MNGERFSNLIRNTLKQAKNTYGIQFSVLLLRGERSFQVSIAISLLQELFLG